MKIQEQNASKLVVYSNIPPQVKFSKTQSLSNYPKEARDNKSENSTSFKNSKASYFSILSRRKTAEFAEVLAQQAEERAKQRLQLLKTSFELEKQKLEEEITEAKNKSSLSKLRKEI